MNIQKFFLAALTAALAAPVFALSTDRDQAIEVHADRFDGDEVKQTAVYTGNVIVDQGSMQITGARQRTCDCVVKVHCPPGRGKD